MRARRRERNCNLRNSFFLEGEIQNKQQTSVYYWFSGSEFAAEENEKALREFPETKKLTLLLNPCGVEEKQMCNHLSVRETVL